VRIRSGRRSAAATWSRGARSFSRCVGGTWGIGPAQQTPQQCPMSPWPGGEGADEAHLLEHCPLTRTVALAAESAAEVALLQEATAPPPDVASRLEMDAAPWETAGAGTHRPWRTAVVREVAAS